MFERFTEGSRLVLLEAQDLAVELGSDHIGVAHLLYGCAGTDEETAGRPLHDCGITASLLRLRLPRKDVSGNRVDPDALRAIGIDFEGVNSAIERTFGPGALEAAPDRRVASDKKRRPPLSLQAKQSLESSFRVALELHHKTIAPGHVLLSLLRLDDEFIVSTVEQSDTTLADLSAAVLTRLSAAA